MELGFGQRSSGLAVDGKALRAAVFDENEVRACAGLTMMLGTVAFAPTSDASYVLLQVVSTLFFVECPPSPSASPGPSGSGWPSP